MMNKIKWAFSSMLYCALATQTYAQPVVEKGFVLQESKPLTLDLVLEASQKSYPSSRQLGLVDSLSFYTLDNLQKNFLPQLTIGMQWTYQSDVTQVKIPVPGVTIIPPSKDQYKLQADLSQLIYDGGLTRSQKMIQQLSGGLEKQKWELELYRLRDRVRQLYVGILFFDEQLKQVSLAQQDVQTGMNRTKALLENGLAFQSSLLLLKAEYLKLGQRKTELKSGRRGLLDALSLFMGQPISESTELLPPVFSSAGDSKLQRPELELLNRQMLLTEGQKNLIDARAKPKASFFIQGGYGRPGLNFLKNDPALFYIGGVRLNWSLATLYTRKNDMLMVNVQKQGIALQQEQFVLQTKAQEHQQNAEIDKLEELLEADEQIILLREQVNASVKAQLENGVISASEYLREINATDQARQAKASHQVQLLQARINKQTLLGN